MRRKTDPGSTQSAGRGRSLIAYRSNQQQRKMQPVIRGRSSELPRSISSPSKSDRAQENTDKNFVMRSFSTPDPKQNPHYDEESRRNSDTFYRPKLHGSRTELDADLESFERLEEAFLDMDADQDQTIFGSYRRSPELEEEPKRVVTSILPGSGLQRVCMKPVSSTGYALQTGRQLPREQYKHSSEKSKGEIFYHHHNHR